MNSGRLVEAVLIALGLLLLCLVLAWYDLLDTLLVALLTVACFGLVVFLVYELLQPVR